MNNKIRLIPDRITALENESYTLIEYRTTGMSAIRAEHAQLELAYACDLKSFHV